MDINYKHFSSEEEVMAEIEAMGRHAVPLEFSAEENEDLWHYFESSVYILDGVLELTVAETGETCICERGTRISAPAGVLHREKTEGYKAIIALAVDPATLSQPINKPPVQE